jgi:hypothetical protein
MRISPEYFPLQLSVCQSSLCPPPGVMTASRLAHVSPISSVFLSSLKTEILRRW